MKQDQLFKKGLKIRKAVLGKEYVERSLKNADKYLMPMQELITKSAWGMVWSRPGLSRKMRSVTNIAVLVSRNMPEELELNIKAGLRNGLTKDEIVEVLLQTAIFCGFPAAFKAFHVASKVFAEDDRPAKSK